MNLIDILPRNQILCLGKDGDIRICLLESFPKDYPALASIKIFLEGPQKPISEGNFSIIHVNLTHIPAPQLRAVLDPFKGNITFFAVFPREQNELHLQILSLIASFCRENTSIINTTDDLFRLIQEAGVPGNQAYAQLSLELVFDDLDTRSQGLSSEEAQTRLFEQGPNQLNNPAQTLWIVKLLGNFVSVFALLLWGAGALCFVPGVDMPALGWAIFCVILINGVFSFWQEFNAQKAVSALSSLLPSLVQVLRDGQEMKIPAQNLVPGDIITIDEGDRIPADCRLITADDLKINNACLTGESRAVYKTSQTLTTARYFLWTEIPNLVFAGTQTISGHGTGVVIGTGMGTQIGKIAKLTQEVKHKLSPLQKEMKSIVNVLTLVSLGIGGVFFFLGQFFGGLTVLGAFLFTIGITVANIPEGLLPTMSLALALGVQRMARRKVLVKDLASVETLGGTTVICTDKTGTLTTNRICVRDLWVGGRSFKVEGTDFTPEGQILDWDLEHTPSISFFLTAVLCNNSDLAKDNGEWIPIGDPTEAALLVLARKAHWDPKVLKKAYVRIGHLPFESVRKLMSVLVLDPEGKTHVFTKGAPIELLDRCTHWDNGGNREPLTDFSKEAIRNQVNQWAQSGRRTLGLATKEWVPGMDFSKETGEQGLTFLGMTGMIDPPRPEVPQAIAQCQRAGIRIIMITGDFGPTAAAIAKEIGLSSDALPRVLTGRDVESLSEKDLLEALGDKSPLVFARMDPGHKMKIVSLLMESGEIVAVTGDGINDAAALKKADIGIAMGSEVNDVVKEAARVVILDGNFASIVAGVEEGRGVYANIRKFVTYVFSSNVPEMLPFLGFVFFGIPLPLTVMQILAVDLGTDMVPALGLGTETPEKGIMDRPPRSPKERLVNPFVFFRAYLFLGLLEGILAMGAFFWANVVRGWSPGLPLPNSGPDYLAATTMTFAGIVACQIGNVLVCRTERASLFSVGIGSNRLVLWGILMEMIVLLALVYIPFFQGIFGTMALGWADWLILPIFPLIIVTAEELRKKNSSQREIYRGRLRSTSFKSGLP